MRKLGVILAMSKDPAIDATITAVENLALSKDTDVSIFFSFTNRRVAS